MSVQVLGWVLDESPVDVHAHRLALLSLANHAHADGTGAYPSVATIAAESRQSVRNAQYALRALEADKRIRRVGTTSKGTTIWQVLMDARAGAEPYVNMHKEGGAKSAPPGDATVAPGGAQPPAPEPSSEPSEPPSHDRTVQQDEGGSERASGAPQLDFFRRPGGASIDVAPGHDLGPEPGGQLTEDQVATWAKIRTRLQADAAEFTWHTWLQAVELVAWRGDELTLAAPDHTRSWVRDRYMSVILATASEVVGHQVTATAHVQPLPAATTEREGAAP